ncbi:MAG: AmmeMemoRadiSam system protein B [Gemmatimonadaceae bacterium]
MRPPAVAGTFYPGDRRVLAASIDAMLGSGVRHPGRPKALVVPHAGYVYSGPIAASAYLQLREPFPTRVVLLGPSHFEPVRGMALPSADAFATPLGDVPVDAAAVDALAGAAGVVTAAAAHRWEHSLEVQLPFLQRILPGFTLLPLSVGQPRVDDVAAVLDTLWGGDETLIVVSTDLSHYLPYEDARTVDARTARAILARDAAIDDEQACGSYGLRGLLLVAHRRTLSVVQLDLRNSGDTAGDRSRVVGYGAFAFYEGKAS